MRDIDTLRESISGPLLGDVSSRWHQCLYCWKKKRNRGEERTEGRREEEDIYLLLKSCLSVWRLLEVALWNLTPKLGEKLIIQSTDRRTFGLKWMIICD